MDKLVEGQNKEHIGRYEIESEIGRGGMSVVYRAFEPTLGRTVALKVVSPHLAGQPAIVARFRHEAISAARLRHPNIAMLYEFGQENGQAFLAMEYFPGESLRQLLEKGPLPQESILNILNQIAQALDYAHSMGVIHRDVKPNNILVEENNHAILVDFGLADMTDNSLVTPDGVVLGTPHYMAPEQAAGRSPVNNSDQYSLATVAYEMLTGSPPFHYINTAAVIHAHIYEIPSPPSEVNPLLPVAVNNVLLRALAKTPQDRYPSLAAFMTDLESAFTPPPPAPRQARLISRLAVPALGGIGVALLLYAYFFPGGLTIGPLIIGKQPTPPLPQQTIWAYDPGFVSRSEPVAAGDSLVVESSNGRITVLKAGDGSLRWQTAAGDGSFGSPSANSELVFVGNENESVEGLSLQSGGPVWNTRVNGKVRLAPVLYQDRLVALTNKGYVYVLQAGNGRMIWNRPLAASTINPVASQGIIFVSSGSSLYALDLESGQVIWEFTSPSLVTTSPTFSDNMVIFGTEQGLLHILNLADGIEQWVYQAPGSLNTPPIVGNSMLYVPDQAGYVTAINLQKKEIVWKFKAGAAVEASPLLNGETLVVGADNAVIYFLNSKNGQLLGNIRLGATIESAPISANGTIFIRADKIYAIKPLTP